MINNRLPLWLGSKQPAYSAGDSGSVPGGRPAAGGNGNLPQCGRLENPAGRGGRQTAVRGVTKESAVTQ